MGSSEIISGVSAIEVGSSKYRRRKKKFGSNQVQGPVMRRNVGFKWISCSKIPFSLWISEGALWITSIKMSVFWGKMPNSCGIILF